MCNGFYFPFFSKVFLGLLFVLVIVALVAEADGRQKRSPILGLLLAKKLLHGGNSVLDLNVNYRHLPYYFDVVNNN